MMFHNVIEFISASCKYSAEAEASCKHSRHDVSSRVKSLSMFYKVQDMKLPPEMEYQKWSTRNGVPEMEHITKRVASNPIDIPKRKKIDF